MIKLVYTTKQAHTILTGTCTYDYSLLKYHNGTYTYKCITHFHRKIYLPECIECLCQSAELLEGELSGKINV